MERQRADGEGPRTRERGLDRDPLRRPDADDQRLRGHRDGPDRDRHDAAAPDDAGDLDDRLGIEEGQAGDGDVEDHDRRTIGMERVDEIE